MSRRRFVFSELPEARYCQDPSAVWFAAPSGAVMWRAAIQPTRPRPTSMRIPLPPLLKVIEMVLAGLLLWPTLPQLPVTALLLADQLCNLAIRQFLPAD